jgi:hypothetical protein
MDVKNGCYVSKSTPFSVKLDDYNFSGYLTFKRLSNNTVNNSEGCQEHYRGGGKS